MDRVGMTATRDIIKKLIIDAQKYELGAENDEGMNSYAFTARHKPLDREVFLKVYDADPDNATFFEEPRFLVEVTRSGPDSKNLVEVYDAEVLGTDYILLAMEYVHGGSLLTRLVSGGVLPLMSAIRTAIGILHGVSRLHNANLVHRDIKPANVMLENTETGYVPKLGDFGSVARLSTPNGSVTASRHSALYVPPEGWAHPSTYDIRSDLYQVGMVLHEMCNGALPYTPEHHLDKVAHAELKKRGAKSLNAIPDYEAWKIVEEAIARRASKANLLTLGPSQPYVPKSLRSIIRKATSPEPDKRYKSASEFMSALGLIHVPNWVPCKDALCCARAWKGADWAVMGTAPNVTVKRTQTGGDKWRKWGAFTSVAEAVEAVSKYKD
jgi:serine/threonine protein kinase